MEFRYQDYRNGFYELGVLADAVGISHRADKDFLIISVQIDRSSVFPTHRKKHYSEQRPSYEEPYDEPHNDAIERLAPANEFQDHAHHLASPRLSVRCGRGSPPSDGGSIRTVRYFTITLNFAQDWFS